MFVFSDYSFCCWNVYRNIQVQEKLFKILMRQSYNSKGWLVSVLQFNIRNDQGAAKASILKLMQNIQLKVVIFFFMNLWIAKKNIISVFIKWTQFEVVSQVQLRKQIVETMVACHMKAKYIYTYLNTNTNTNANAPSSSSVTARFCWFVFIFLSSSSFCICPICGSLMAMFAKANRSVCYPNWIFAQGPLSFLHWNIEH